MKPDKVYGYTFAGGDIAEFGIGDGGGPVVHKQRALPAAQVHYARGHAAAAQKLRLKTPLLKIIDYKLAVDTAAALVGVGVHIFKIIKGAA